MDGSHPTAQPSEQPMIMLREVCLAYGDQRVLDGVSLKVSRDEVVAVVGPSGTGKSTLIKVVAGLVEPDSGEVILGSDRIALAFQYGALFTSLTVEENIALALEQASSLERKAIDTRINEVLKMVALEEVREHYPSELSGGMQKRVGIARALATHPDIMLYDEPSSGLDPVLADRLEKDLRSINHQLRMATLVVTHEIPTIYNLADRVAMLYEGRFVFEGNKAEFFTTQEPLVVQFRTGRTAGIVPTT